MIDSPDSALCHSTLLCVASNSQIPFPFQGCRCIPWPLVIFNCVTFSSDPKIAHRLVSTSMAIRQAQKTAAATKSDLHLYACCNPFLLYFSDARFPVYACICCSPHSPEHWMSQSSLDDSGPSDALDARASPCKALTSYRIRIRLPSAIGIYYAVR